MPVPYRGPGRSPIDQAEESVNVASTVNNRIDVYDINDQYRYSFGLDVTADGAEQVHRTDRLRQGLISFEAGSLPNPTRDRGQSSIPIPR